LYRYSKATLAGTLHKAAGLGSLHYRTEEEQQALTDEQAAQVATKMESVASQTMKLLMSGAKGGGVPNASKMDEAKEGCTTITKTFRNAVMKRQMAKISAASAFGIGGKASTTEKGGSSLGSVAEGGGTVAGTVAEDSLGPMSLRERAAASKGKAPEDSFIAKREASSREWT
jgi:hypothetical protein